MVPHMHQSCGRATHIRPFGNYPQHGRPRTSQPWGRVVKFGEAIDRLATRLGAEVSVNLHHPGPRYSTPQERRRFTAKFYHQFPDAVAPEFAIGDPLLTVIWEQPNHPHDKGRNLLRRTLIQNNVWDTQVNHLWCVPEPGFKATTLEQNAAYRPWLLNAMLAAGAPYVLLVGARPAWSWRPDLRLTKMQGRVGIMLQKYVVMPVNNPDIITKEQMVGWRANVERFVRIMKEGGDTHHLSSNCVECGNALYWYDSDGVAWCKDHAEAGVKAQQKGTEKWQIASMHANQQSIL